MQMQFISGLPRSGSTLLASILRQNKKFYASIMSPVGRIITDTHTAMGPDNEAAAFISDYQRSLILKQVFEGYYETWLPEVAFDNNRRWCANLALIHELFPDARVICCVRHPAAIVDSFERLWRAHPLSLSKIYGAQSNLNVYQRTQALLGQENVVGFSLNSFREAFYGPLKSKLLIVNYDDLCRFPANVLEDIHKAIGAAPFKYNFDRIEPIPDADAFDGGLATPGLHDLKPKIVYEQRETILPPDLWNALPKPFWYPVQPVPVKETSTKAE